MENTLVLINPKQREQKVKKLIKLLNDEGFKNYKICPKKKDINREVKNFCVSQFKYLLIWGGDGTVHRAINVLTREKTINESLKDKAIGFFKGGSGNGIQESYEISGNIKTQILNYKESIKKNYFITTDLIKITSKDFIKYTQLVGLGLDAEILEERRNNRYSFGKYKDQVKKGFLNYFFSSLKVFFGSNNFLNDYLLTFYEGYYLFFGTRVNAIFPFKKIKRLISAPIVETGTRPYYGNMFKICPYVICNDGYMDVYLYCFKHKLTILLNIIDIYFGQHHRINKRFEKKNKGIIEHYKVKQLKIKVYNPINFHIDGELFKCHAGFNNPYTLTLKILPEELNLIVPPAFYNKFHPFEYL